MTPVQRGPRRGDWRQQSHLPRHAQTHHGAVGAISTRGGRPCTLSFTSMQLAAGLVIADRFRLVRPLGQGGMGAVWLAQHTGLDVPCAVKFIHEEAAKSADLRARFEREAKAAAQLRSPHVVQILDHGVWQGAPYIAMELLEGEDLGQRLRRRRPLSPRETLVIATQVGRALSKAHAAGLVHRDLKPANIFLVRDDEREIAKVLDFGVAKVKETGLDDATQTGAVLGTPFYMSPEQARGSKSIDHRSDLWALAVVVYQCLIGKLPFRGDALGDLLVKIIIDPLPVPSAAGPVPPGFDAWWARAAAREPADQPNLMNKLDQLTTQLAEVKKQNDDIKKQNDDIKKENDNIKKQLCKPSKTIINNNQTYNVHAQTFVQQNYPGAPLLKKLKDYEILDNYDEDEDSNLIEKLVHYQEEKLLDQFFGDFIITSYKKKDPKEQSLWTSDSARLTYIIKELIENENDDEIWNKDPKAKRTSTYIIDPMLEYIRNNISIYFRINNKYLKSLDFKQAQNYREIYRVLGEIKMDITNGIIKKQIIKYITPYFQLANTTTKSTK